MLLYRVPIEAAITEEWIETGRKHCRMTPERLAVLRSEPHARHWRYLLEKRQRRLAWKNEHGQVPDFTPAAPDERDHTHAVTGLRTHWKKVRPMISKMKKRPAAQWTKLANRYEAAKLGGDKADESIATLLCEDHLTVHLKAREGTLTVKDLAASKKAFNEIIAGPYPIVNPANTGLAPEKEGLCARGKPIGKSCPVAPGPD